MNRKGKTLISWLLAFFLILSVQSISAGAVSQSEIDALKKQRDKIAGEKAAQQAIVDELEAQHASVLERKLALDERNSYTMEQIELNEQEIALYDRMIEEKAQEVEAAVAPEPAPSAGPVPHAPIPPANSAHAITR